ncbi:hypothetical protein [Flammeovirga kamogawensis]|uniref:RHS repeat protein n=1 Tax=Flammeovirga kamogawensis TaxID=373891 RepID=A0ABX8H2L7_9BACT|nr:hypothetical protein [Flammeovirga kamogawensis]MBB6460134.1 YD repeat-containing protein [Flammeovirga kamogawensis]QWG09948.1 hypothetical protein KM029_19905 [Flammeovirga kamogawensis]TRX65456.1 hypothetical protein EO216_23330 [Flammeovirga kamogawensis]
MKTKIQIFIAFTIFCSCEINNRNKSDEFTASYIIESYYHPDKYISTKYYDSCNNLLKVVTRDGMCFQYIYNKTNQLTEIVSGRNCSNGRRSIFIYDSAGNHLGNYEAMDSVINLDTIAFEQTKFYNQLNQLIQEKVSERKAMEGDVVQTWNFYKYDSTLKTSLVVKQNEITAWHGIYKYDSTGNIIELRKTRNKQKEIETYTYNKLGQLIEKEVKNNEKLETPMGVFDIPVRRTTYKYDSANFMYEEVIYDDGKFILSKIFKKLPFTVKKSP